MLVRRAAPLLVLLAIALASLVGGASAHASANSADGKVRVTWGLLEEPGYTHEKNRLDLNVSIREGARVEIKGVQQLRLIAPAVDWEVRRQVHLLDAKKELASRGATEADYLRPPVDVSDLFAGSDSKAMANVGDTDVVMACALPHLAGLIGRKGKEDIPPPRVGRELADYAKVQAGVKGIFHSDELPAYGITAEQCGHVASRLNVGASDGYAMVVAPRPVAERALAAVLQRAAMLLRGVPEETRDLEPDGSSRYLRPLPGGARMYPETDVPPIRLDLEKVHSLRTSMKARGIVPPQEARLWLASNWPALTDVHVQRLVRSGRYPAFAVIMREFPELPLEDATALLIRDELDAFLTLARDSRLPRESARIVLRLWDEAEEKYEQTTKRNASFDREKEMIPRTLAILAAVREGKLTREGILPTLTDALVTGRDVDDIVASSEAASVPHLEHEVDRIIDERRELVLRQRERAAGAIMGPLMAKYRGKISGEELARIVEERLQRFLNAGG